MEINVPIVAQPATAAPTTVLDTIIPDCPEPVQHNPTSLRTTKDNTTEIKQETNIGIRIDGATVVFSGLHNSAHSHLLLEYAEHDHNATRSRLAKRKFSDISQASDADSLIDSRGNGISASPDSVNGNTLSVPFARRGGRKRKRGTNAISARSRVPAPSLPMLGADQDELASDDLPEPYEMADRSATPPAHQDEAHRIYTDEYRTLRQLDAFIRPLTQFDPSQRSTASLYALATNAADALREWQDEYIAIDRLTAPHATIPRKAVTGNRQPLDDILYQDLLEADLYDYTFDPKRIGHQNPLAQTVNRDASGRELRHRQQRNRAGADGNIVNRVGASAAGSEDESGLRRARKPVIKYDGVESNKSRDADGNLIPKRGRGGSRGRPRGRGRGGRGGRGRGAASGIDRRVQVMREGSVFTSTTLDSSDYAMSREGSASGERYAANVANGNATPIKWDMHNQLSSAQASGGSTVKHELGAESLSQTKDMPSAKSQRRSEIMTEWWAKRKQATAEKMEADRKSASKLNDLPADIPSQHKAQPPRIPASGHSSTQPHNAYGSHEPMQHGHDPRSMQTTYNTQHGPAANLSRPPAITTYSQQGPGALQSQPSTRGSQTVTGHRQGSLASYNNSSAGGLQSVNTMSTANSPAQYAYPDAPGNAGREPAAHYMPPVNWPATSQRASRPGSISTSSVIANPAYVAQSPTAESPVPKVTVECIPMMTTNPSSRMRFFEDLPHPARGVPEVVREPVWRIDNRGEVIAIPVNAPRGATYPYPVVRTPTYTAPACIPRGSLLLDMLDHYVRAGRDLYPVVRPNHYTVEGRHASIQPLNAQMTSRTGSNAQQAQSQSRGNSIAKPRQPSGQTQMQMTTSPQVFSRPRMDKPRQQSSMQMEMQMQVPYSGPPSSLATSTNDRQRQRNSVIQAQSQPQPQLRVQPQPSRTMQTDHSPISAAPRGYPTQMSNMAQSQSQSRPGTNHANMPLNMHQMYSQPQAPGTLQTPSYGAPHGYLPSNSQTLSRGSMPTTAQGMQQGSPPTRTHAEASVSAQAPAQTLSHTQPRVVPYGFTEAGALQAQPQAQTQVQGHAQAQVQGQGQGHGPVYTQTPLQNSRPAARPDINSLLN